MIVARTRAELLPHLRKLAAKGESLALVPTMGFLHDGHLSLVREGARRMDRVALSLFVNPSQFGPNEDLDKYPRDLEGDLQKSEEAGVWLVYAPKDPREVYPEGFSTWTDVEGTVVEGLCGAKRPGHFRGVATVVLKLLHLFRPQVALFGKKDFQQLAVIRKMVDDLDLSPWVEIFGGETIRETDGLALSSRNAYLSEDERRRAVSLIRGLGSAKRLYDQGERNGARLLEEARAVILPEVDELDYLTLVDARTLAPVQEATGPACLLVAAFVGKTRLIDNMELGR